MTAFYEVWDDNSNNRVGGPFATQAEAEALLGDVLRVSGPAAVRDMAIILWRARSTGGYDASTVLDGAAFLAARSGTAASGSAAPGSVAHSA